MKSISILFFACLLAVPVEAALGQTRRRTTGSNRRTRAAASKNAGDTANAATSMRTAATRVADQIKSLGRFLYLYGPISKELASNEAGAQSGQSSTVSEAMQRNRQKLRDVFRDYRVQMDELETLFSSTPELRIYYTKLLGVAASAAQAEEFVSGGRYDQAGKSLLDVMSRLTDTLLEIR